MTFCVSGEPRAGRVLQEIADVAGFDSAHDPTGNHHHQRHQTRPVGTAMQCLRRGDGGIEFWLARDLQFLLGYAKWENFLNVVSKAKTACDISGHDVFWTILLNVTGKWSTQALAASAKSTTSC